jgi:2-oxo-4-hydroxy-4-carboxy-5-ureidoimidazoline decarboxylase
MNVIDRVNKMSKSNFISIFGNIFEKTDWIAKKAYTLKPFNNLKELFSNFMKIFENASSENHLKILNSHPDLAVKKKLTKDSRNEQNSKNQFKFPFIIAVKGKNKNQILKNFRERVKNNFKLEFKEAKNQVKKQVKKIAKIRLQKTKMNKKLGAF